MIVSELMDKRSGALRGFARMKDELTSSQREVASEFFNVLGTKPGKVLLVSSARQTGKTFLLAYIANSLVTGGFDKPILVVVDNLDLKRLLLSKLTVKSDLLVVVTRRSELTGFSAGVILVDDFEFVGGIEFATRIRPCAAWHNGTILAIGTDCAHMLPVNCAKHLSML